MYEWMITYKYEDLGLDGGKIRTTARFVDHAPNIDEALENAHAIIKHHRPSGYTVISIERQD